MLIYSFSTNRNISRDTVSTLHIPLGCTSCRRLVVLFFSLIVLAFIITTSPAQAGRVQVQYDDEQKEVAIIAESASLKEMLEASSKTLNFELKGASKLQAHALLTTNVSGTPERVLKRLLRNRNYLIVRSPSDSNEIRSVAILNSNYGSSASGGEGKSEQKGYRVHRRHLR